MSESSNECAAPPSGWAALSNQLRAHFPKPCKPRKRHRCRLCDQRIEVGELCCSWSGLESGEGYSTAYAHPECYQSTLDGKWDEGDWESCLPGDLERPNNDSPSR